MEHGPKTHRGQMQVEAFKCEFRLLALSNTVWRGIMVRHSPELRFMMAIVQTSDDRFGAALKKNPTMIEDWLEVRRLGMDRDYEHSEKWMDENRDKSVRAVPIDDRKLHQALDDLLDSERIGWNRGCEEGEFSAFSG